MFADNSRFVNNRTIATVTIAICLLITSLSWMYMRVPCMKMFTSGSEMCEWILYGYIIAEVSMIIVGGVMVDKIGSKTVLFLGMPLFILCGLAICYLEGIEFIVAMRVIQGIGAGLIFSVALSFIAQAYNNKDRHKPHKIMTLAFAVGSLFGTVVGYYFVDVIGNWRVFVYIASLIVLICGSIAYFNMPNVSRDHVKDAPGLILTILTIAVIMTYTQTVNVHFKMISLESVAFMIACAVLIILLICFERRSKDPIIPKGIKKNHVGMISGMFFAGLCGIGMLQFIIIFVVIYCNKSLYVASEMLLFLIAGGVVTSLLGTKYMYRIGFKPFALLAAVLAMIGFISGYFLIDRGILGIGTMLFILGLSFGCIVTETAIGIQNITPRDHGGALTGMLMSSRFIGIILGMAVYDNFIRMSIADMMEQTGEPGLDFVIWLFNHFYEFYVELVDAFKGIFEECLIVAGIAVISVFLISYFLLDDKEMKAMEESKGEE